VKEDQKFCLLDFKKKNNRFLVYYSRIHIIVGTCLLPEAGTMVRRVTRHWSFDFDKIRVTRHWSFDFDKIHRVLWWIFNRISYRVRVDVRFRVGIRVSVKFGFRLNWNPWKKTFSYKKGEKKRLCLVIFWIVVPTSGYWPRLKILGTILMPSFGAT